MFIDFKQVFQTNLCRDFPVSGLEIGVVGLGVSAPQRPLTCRILLKLIMVDMFSQFGKCGATMPRDLPFGVRQKLRISSTGFSTVTIWIRVERRCNQGYETAATLLRWCKIQSDVLLLNHVPWKGQCTKRDKRVVLLCNGRQLDWIVQVSSSMCKNWDTAPSQSSCCKRDSLLWLRSDCVSERSQSGKTALLKVTSV